MTSSYHGDYQSLVDCPQVELASDKSNLSVWGKVKKGLGFFFFLFSLDSQNHCSHFSVRQAFSMPILRCSYALVGSVASARSMLASTNGLLSEFENKITHAVIQPQT